MHNEAKIFIVIVLMFLSGFIAGHFIFPLQIETVKTIFVSERLSSCENKGGSYHLFWDGFENKYIDYCTVKNDEIENF